MALQAITIDTHRVYCEISNTLTDSWAAETSLRLGLLYGYTTTTEKSPMKWEPNTSCFVQKALRTHEERIIGVCNSFRVGSMLGQNVQCEWKPRHLMWVNS